MVVLSISQEAQATPVDKAELEEIRRNLVLPCSPYINNSSPVSPIQSSNNRIILNSVILHSSWQSWMWFVLLPFIMNMQNLDRIRISGQDQIRTVFPKFVMENCWLRLDFPWWIWEIQSGFPEFVTENDKFGKSNSYGQWLSESGFSVMNLENDRETSMPTQQEPRRRACSLGPASSSCFWASSTHFRTYLICMGVARGVVSAGSNKKRCSRARNGLFWQQEE